MGQYYHPQVVQSGLILCYDFANVISYTGSGITVNNISQSGFGATLINSPTYSSDNLGHMSFLSSSSQYGIFPGFGTTLTNFTVETWFQINKYPFNQVPAIVTQRYTGVAPVNRINFSFGFNGADTTGAFDGKINGGFYDGTWRLTSGIGSDVYMNKWLQGAVTYDGSTITQYSNGISHSTKSRTGTSLSHNFSNNILMKRWDDPNFIEGKLAIVRIYNRSLTATEILKNFNANRGRFGI